MEVVFDRFHIKAFWLDVVQEINNKLGISLDLDPLVCILRICSYNTWSSSKIQLLKIVLLTARRCILMQWISKKQPKKNTTTRTQCTKSLLDVMPFEALSFFLKTNHFSYTKLGILFCPIWETAWVGSWKTDYVALHDMKTTVINVLFLFFLLLFFVCFVFCCCYCSSLKKKFMVLSKIIKQ